MNIAGKRILITGSAVRLGSELVRRFADLNANIIIHCNNSYESGLKLLNEIGGMQRGHALIKCDLSKFDQLDNLAKILNSVDILINNASVFDTRSITEDTLNNGQTQFNINFWAPVMLMQKFYASKLNSDGIIINMLDSRVNKNALKCGFYTLSKMSLSNATLMAAVQMAPNIRVNGIALGVVMPPVWLPESKMKKSIDTVPLRHSVSLDELFNTCRFIVENESITGEILNLSGGLHL